MPPRLQRDPGGTGVGRGGTDPTADPAVYRRGQPDDRRPPGSGVHSAGPCSTGSICHGDAWASDRGVAPGGGRGGGEERRGGPIDRLSGFAGIRSIHLVYYFRSVDEGPNPG